MSSPAPSAFDGSADRSSVELISDFVPGFKAVALKREHDDTRPFSFRPAGRVNDRESRQAYSARNASSNTGAQTYVSPFGRANTNQGPASHGQKQQPFFSSASTHSALFAQPAPSSAPSSLTTFISPRAPQGPEDAGSFSQRRASDKAARPTSTDSRVAPADVGGRPTTRDGSVERNADVVSLLWEKVKERETAIARKDAEIAELVDLKENAVKELATVKTLAKDAVAASAKRLEEMHAQMEVLKSQATATFPSADAVRESLDELRDLKQTIRVVLSELEPLLVPGESCLENQVSQTKFVVRELQLSLQTKQQIADLLRDRIDQAMLELSEAKVKFQALEDCQNRRILSEKQHAEQLRDISANMAALADALASEKEKLLEVTKNAERLQAANCRLVHENAEKEALLDRQDSREQELANVKLELALLENESGELRARAEALKTVNEELATCKLQLHDAFSATEKLREQLQDQQKDRDTLQEKLSEITAELRLEVSNRVRLDDVIQTKEKEVTSLTEKLANMGLAMNDEGKKRGALEQDIRVVQHERDGVVQQVSALQSQLQAAENNAEQTRTQLLAVTAQAAAAAQSVAHHDIIIHALRAELSEQKAASDALRDARTTLQVEMDRLLLERGGLQQRSQELQLQVDELSERLAASTARTEGLQERIEGLQGRMDGLQERLEEKATVLRGAHQELATLREKASQQEAELAVQTALAHALRSDSEKVEQQRAADRDMLEKTRLSTESLYGTLQTKDAAIEQLRADLSKSRDERATLQANLELARGQEALLTQRLAGSEQELALRFEGWESQRAQMNGLLQAAQLRADELSNKFAELQKQPVVPSTCSSKEKEALDMLVAVKLRCQQFEDEVASLKKTASTLGQRYDKKLLSPEEKDVVSRIAKDARAIYEQELLFKNNELKKVRLLQLNLRILLHNPQRENIIKDLSARNQLLEEQFELQMRAAPTPAVVPLNMQTTQRSQPNGVAVPSQSRPGRVAAVPKVPAPAPTPTVRFQEIGPSSDASYRLPSSSSQPSDNWEPPAKATKKRPAPAQAAKAAEAAKRVRTMGHETEAKPADKPRKGKATATAAKASAPDTSSAATTKTRTRKRASANGG